MAKEREKGFGSGKASATLLHLIWLVLATKFEYIHHKYTKITNSILAGGVR